MSDAPHLVFLRCYKSRRAFAGDDGRILQVGFFPWTPAGSRDPGYGSRCECPFFISLIALVGPVGTQMANDADPFGPPVRPARSLADKLKVYGELGFDAVQFHDDEPFSDPDARLHLAEGGMKRPLACAVGREWLVTT